MLSKQPAFGVLDSNLLQWLQLFYYVTGSIVFSGLALQYAQGCLSLDRPGGGLFATGGETRAGFANQALEFPVGCCAEPRNQVYLLPWRLRAVRLDTKGACIWPWSAANTKQRVPDGAWRVHLISRGEALVQKFSGHAAACK